MSESATTTRAQPRVVSLPQKKLVGVRARMSLAADGTASLWRTLMPRRHSIAKRVGTDRISMRIYEPAGMPPGQMFAPQTEFEKWAAFEVTAFDDVPDDLSRHVLAGGDYVALVHNGPAATFLQSMLYLFNTWLPASGFVLDDREQFEILPDDWRADDPSAHEEIWLPIRSRA